MRASRPGARRSSGVTATDIAKRLLDLGFYAPSIYFPLIVEEALMIEPTETESKETLDAVLRRDDPDRPRGRDDARDRSTAAPVTTPVRRLDQTLAARQPNLRWTPRAESRPEWAVDRSAPWSIGRELGLPRGVENAARAAHPAGAA